MVIPINKDSLTLSCLCKGETFLPIRERQGLPVSPLPTPIYGDYPQLLEISITQQVAVASAIA
ncbi:hypothetical protein BJP34_10860 [Moorena producens PAL-8-15-08-1]|uniref:Uncharacterized protein n=1 Tax=Moorena producens PAL-8-15-08-1 TaxID=1458985 RepID=A0A1D8TR32_9CYAN|nr:hypothetical protein BJP34_10860 [Moorena producens PAL-8-15-08-1]